MLGVHLQVVQSSPAVARDSTELRRICRLSVAWTISIHNLACIMVQRSETFTTSAHSSCSSSPFRLENLKRLWLHCTQIFQWAFRSLGCFPRYWIKINQTKYAQVISPTARAVCWGHSSFLYATLSATFLSQRPPSNLPGTFPPGTIVGVFPEPAPSKLIGNLSKPASTPPIEPYYPGTCPRTFCATYAGPSYPGPCLTGVFHRRFSHRVRAVQTRK